ncbi:MAG: phosphatidate cytidylyltransferase [Marinicaulis sp.]|nr:phosphatidate cytidylyltransferase [Marinicaulis sp.]NNL90368.1 phosphatidate cytidylyltransferase [Marinicaulis sp.]
MNGVEHESVNNGAQKLRSLALRVISSIILIPIVVSAIHFGERGFTALVAFLCVVMVFEWTRMVERKEFSPAFYVLAGGAAAAMFAASSGKFLLAFAIAVTGGALAWLTVPKSSDARQWVLATSLYIIVPSLALVWLRLDAEQGRSFTFLLFLIVWAADIGAFIFGKLIGGPIISHALSPSKTWAGIGGGVCGGILAGALAAPFFFGSEMALAGALLGSGLGASSVLGDLAESRIKRNFGVKDISSFIPGHGGVLDRLDGMIFATIAMTGVYFVYMLL